MNIAFLSLGGNLGDRRSSIIGAMKQIEKSCGKILKSSGIYKSEAWGHKSKNVYYNSVIKLQTKLDAISLLKNLASIETKMGRQKSNRGYEDRIIDLDILFFNAEIVKNKVLQIPHPHLQDRKFVLVPFVEIEPKWMHPLLKKTSNQLLNSCRDILDVELISDNEKPKYICIEGNIGSGKSTLCDVLSKKWKSTYIKEKFSKKHLLPLFYECPKTFAYLLEYSYLIDRFEQITNTFNKKPKLVLSDFTIYKSLWFAKLNLKKKEYAGFKKHFEALSTNLPQPDVIVKLTTDTKTLRKNIQKRGRGYEQQISARYLRDIENNYTKGLELMQCKKLYIEIKNYDGKVDKSVVRQIENFIKENFG